MNTVGARLFSAITLCCVVNAPTFNRVQTAEGDFLERFRGTWFWHLDGPREQGLTER